MELIIKTMCIAMTCLSYMIKILVISWYVLSLFSCSWQKSDISKLKDNTYMLNQKISFDCLATQHELFAKTDGYLLVFYLDSAYCTPCSIEDIAIWKGHTKTLKDFKIDVLLISNNSSIRTFVSEMQLNYPSFYDISSTFKNSYIHSENTQMHTFMTNSDLRIVWIGNPLYNQKSWKLFNKFMQTELKSNISF